MKCLREGFISKLTQACITVVQLDGQLVKKKKKEKKSMQSRVMFETHLTIDLFIISATFYASIGGAGHPAL